MKLSIFTTLGGGNYQPTQRQDSLTEALDCYTDLADEVIVVNGSNIGINDGWLSYDGLTKSDGRSETVIKEIFHVWENEFDWRFIGQQFQRGYEACTGDWAVRADLDFIWTVFFKKYCIPDLNRHRYPLSLVIHFSGTDS